MTDEIKTVPSEALVPKRNGHIAIPTNMLLVLVTAISSGNLLQGLNFASGDDVREIKASVRGLDEKLQKYIETGQDDRIEIRYLRRDLDSLRSEFDKSKQ
jgi:hypothetical protein